MFIIDQPYASAFLINTIKENNIPVVNNLGAINLNSLSNQQAVEWCSKKALPALYKNSENAID